MRIDVLERGYASAVEELVGGNRYAAHLAVTLSRALGGLSGMAGDDRTATEFAGSYDEAAVASVEALGSLVAAFGSLARLTEASVANHAVADSRATLPGWARSVVGPRTVADGAVGVRLPAPPSSLGADDSGPSGPAGVVLDLLAEVFWPNAETGRVRAAGRAWGEAAGALDLLVDHCDRARDALADQRSPEIPLALAALSELRGHLVDLGAQLAGLGAACGEYADHVEAKRAELRDLLEDLALELGLTAALGGALTLLSAGAAGAAAGGLGATRIAAASSRARGILDSLRFLVSGPALQTRSVAVTASEVGAYGTRVSRARVMLMEAGGRGGAARRASANPFESPTMWIERQRRAGSHMGVKHVQLSDHQLRKRLLHEPGIKGASTFPDAPTAHRAVHDVLTRRRSDVEAWLAGGKRSLPIEEALDDVVGRSMLRSGELVDVKGVFVKLVRDPTQPEGFYVRTAFPKKVVP